MATFAKVGQMAIRNATILTGATISAAGGTSSTLKVTGQKVDNGVQVADFSISDIRLRPSITFKCRPAAMQRDGSWSKQKAEYTIRMPKLLANGTIAINYARGSVEVHPESTDIEITKLITWDAQLKFDADFSDFIKSAVPE